MNTVPQEGEKVIIFHKDQVVKFSPAKSKLSPYESLQAILQAKRVFQFRKEMHRMLSPYEQALNWLLNLADISDSYKALSTCVKANTKRTLLSIHFMHTCIYKYECICKDYFLFL